MNYLMNCLTVVLFFFSLEYDKYSRLRQILMVLVASEKRDATRHDLFIYLLTLFYRVIATYACDTSVVVVVAAESQRGKFYREERPAVVVQ